MKVEDVQVGQVVAIAAKAQVVARGQYGCYVQNGYNRQNMPDWNLSLVWVPYEYCVSEEKLQDLEDYARELNQAVKVGDVW